MAFRGLCAVFLLGCVMAEDDATLLQVPTDKLAQRNYKKASSNHTRRVRQAPYSFLVSRQFANIVELCNSDGTCRTVAKDLHFPQDVAWVDGREFLVVDSGFNRVKRCSTETGFCHVVAGTGGKGFKADQLFNPHGVAILSSSQFLVSDASNHRVQLCTFGDTHCETVAGTNRIMGGAANQLKFPRGLKPLDTETFLVADHMNQRIQKCYVSGGDCATIVSLDDGPWAVSLQSNGNILLNYYSGVMKSCTVNAGGGAHCSEVQGPSHVVVHDSLPDGDILVSNPFSGNVELCSSSDNACSVVVDYHTILHDATSSIRGLAIKP